MDGIVGLTDSERERYQGETNWPARIKVGAVEYFLVSRGYWANYHYWGRVVRAIDGILGVWLYDKRENSGIAQLESADVSTIGGCSPDTSWLFYSRMPQAEEIDQISSAIRDLVKLFPKKASNIPFSMPTSTFPFGGGLPQDHETEGDAKAAGKEAKASVESILAPRVAAVTLGQHTEVEVEEEVLLTEAADKKSKPVPLSPRKRKGKSQPDGKVVLEAMEKPPPVVASRTTRTKTRMEVKDEPDTKGKQEASKPNKGKWKGWAIVEDVPVEESGAEDVEEVVAEVKPTRSKRHRRG
ncbi:uncharacterized protein MELLADRAFT_90440 [Melampsora larici-populina 98AG31]|uniref:Uncharacterized protein n=1 Tax=Melampsora larici-populina (strain 98AG31 / pathotype 3-4-7) TaxID=747676 RepID=F4RWY2_MELLP|nr:uncharacterized protein MELLADRAFT_90440 [Melampsora larici-populina 98AG31]EGG03142.1 hypothetical protein MELLADRAFT_90440 [Melampsora larici-populina 98AG31]